jgi:serine protease AprX
MSHGAKLSNGLAQRLDQLSADDQVPIIVRYAPDRRIVRHKGPPLPGIRESYNYRLQPLVHMHATPHAIETLEEDAEIVRIYQDLPVRALLDSAVPLIQIPRVQALGWDGSGIRIAIVDTGIDPEHPDFQDRVAEMVDWVGEGLVDENGHGTHCASIAAGSGTASGGRYRGVAPAATIYAAKVLRRNGQGMMSDVMAGIDWAVDQGVHIISLSLGGPGPSDGHDALAEMCDAAMASGVVVCVAAGNDGPANRTVGSPGASREAITVGASTDEDMIASFSSRGPTADGRVKPDIVVPGHLITAARAKGTTMGTPIDAYYAEASGTSMATPVAAGLCALLLQKEPDLTPAQVKARLMETAVDLGEHANTQGSGRADALRALENQISAPPENPGEPTEPGGPGIGQGCLTALVQAVLQGKRRG